MTDLNSAHEVVYKKAPLWGRLLVNVLGTVFAYMLTFFLGVAFGPPDIFIYFIFLSTFFLGIILPHLSYKKLDAVPIITFLFLMAWTVILLVMSPIFTKQYFLAEASKILPLYSGVEQVSMTYVPGDMTSSSAVQVVYHSNQVEADYQKMNELYRAAFLEKGYKIDREEAGSHVYFEKVHSSSPKIFLGISKKPNSIAVSVEPQDSHCLIVLFFGGFDSFVSCQTNRVE